MKFRHAVRSGTCALEYSASIDTGRTNECSLLRFSLDVLLVLWRQGLFIIGRRGLTHHISASSARYLADIVNRVFSSDRRRIKQSSDCIPDKVE
jgi:hypothetical protein